MHDTYVVKAYGPSYVFLAGGNEALTLTMSSAAFHCRLFVTAFDGCMDWGLGPGPSLCFPIMGIFVFILNVHKGDVVL